MMADQLANELEQAAAHGYPARAGGQWPARRRFHGRGGQRVPALPCFHACVLCLERLVQAASRSPTVAGGQDMTTLPRLPQSWVRAGVSSVLNDWTRPGPLLIFEHIHRSIMPGAGPATLGN